MRVAAPRAPAPSWRFSAVALDSDPVCASRRHGVKERRLGFLDNFLGWMVMALAVMPVFIVLLLARSAPKRRSPGAYDPDGRRPAGSGNREMSEIQAHEQMLERKARKGARR